MVFEVRGLVIRVACICAHALMLWQRLSSFKAGVLRTELDSEEWRQAVLAEATTSQMLGVTLKFQVRQTYQVGCCSI